jgi:hypothetical protein
VENTETSDSWSRRVNIALIGFAVLGGILLLTEHWAHALPYLPWLLLAACPLMHVFMHRGHSHGDGGSPAGTRGSPTKSHEHGAER